MTIEAKDPRLIDFVLGELDPDEASAIRAAIDAAPDSEAAKEVAALRESFDALQQALVDGGSESLTDTQRDAIAQTAETVVPFPVRTSRIRGVWLGLAATVAVAAGLSMIVLRTASVDTPTTVAWLAEQSDETRDQTPAPPSPSPPEYARLGASETPPQATEMAPGASDATPGATDAAPEATEVASGRAERAEAPNEGSQQRRIVAHYFDSTQATGAEQTTQEAAELRSRGYGGNAGPAPDASGPSGAAVSSTTAEPSTTAVPTEDPVAAVDKADAPSTAIAAEAAAEPEPEPIPEPAPAPEAALESPGSLADDSLLPNDADVAPEPEPAPRRPQYRDRESYAYLPPNPLVAVSAEPLSTFSIDVDTASYANARRFLEGGQLPPPASVRVEDFVNYFDYSYPQPDSGDAFSVHVDFAGCPWAREHRLARIGVQGLEIPIEERPAANLVFLLDVSGSMRNANKLPLVRESILALLEVLDEGDRVAIVTYASQSAVVLRSTDASNMERIRGAITALTAGGSTHGSAGIHEAYRIAQQQFVSGGINRVILCTDGDFNVGVTNNQTLEGLIAEKARSKVFLTVLGFGYGNLQDDRLELLANKGNGNYAYVDDYGEAQRVLVDQVAGTLITIAKDVKIQVEFNPAQVSHYRLIGYENRLLAAPDFNDDTVDAGEIGAGHTVTALYELVPVGVDPQPGVDNLRYQSQPAPPPVEDANPEWINVKLRHKQPEGDVSTRQEHQAIDDGSGPSHRRDFSTAVAAAWFAELLRRPQGIARADLDPVLALARLADDGSAKRRELVELIVTAKTLLP